jgi:hypothetical protein
MAKMVISTSSTPSPIDPQPRRPPCPLNPYAPESLQYHYPTLNYAFRWTHANFSTFHAIQILIVIIKKLM